MLQVTTRLKVIMFTFLPVASARGRCHCSSIRNILFLNVWFKGVGDYVKKLPHWRTLVHTKQRTSLDTSFGIMLNRISCRFVLKISDCPPNLLILGIIGVKTFQVLFKVPSSKPRGGSSLRRKVSNESCPTVLNTPTCQKLWPWDPWGSQDQASKFSKKVSLLLSLSRSFLTRAV